MYLSVTIVRRLQISRDDLGRRTVGQTDRDPAAFEILRSSITPDDARLPATTASVGEAGRAPNRCSPENFRCGIRRFRIVIRCEESAFPARLSERRRGAVCSPPSAFLARLRLRGAFRQILRHETQSRFGTFKTFRARQP